MKELRGYLVVLATLPCSMAGCADGPSSPSLPPSAETQPSVTRVVLTGPRDLSLGESAQFQATANLRDGQQIDITQTAVWLTTQSDIVTVASNGLAAGRSSGVATLEASYGGQRGGQEVLVLPEGTFRLGGMVTDWIDAKQWLPATVEVTEGIGTGLKDVAIATVWDGVELPGLYDLFGVAGRITIVVSVPGYVTQTLDLNVERHTHRDIRMRPITSAP